MRNVKKENKIVAQLLQERIGECGYCCDGCGSTAYQVTASHIIKRSRRRDLITEKGNIRKDCMDCHEKWDSDIIEKMVMVDDFNQRMEYIKSVDELQYNRIIMEMGDKNIKFRTQ